MGQPSAGDYAKWARICGIFCGVVALALSIVALLSSLGAELWIILSAVYSICLSLLVLSIEIPFGPTVTLCPFWSNTIVRALIYIVLAIFTFFGNWWVGIPFCICIIFYIVAYAQGLHTVGYQRIA
mmetsp:Transcript_15218/g.16939  ORF Transcript_15218/g.16939 Transcript_15218/m.16939 type:complete len:126 (+) Transcript_15218:18-395(+)